MGTNLPLRRHNSLTYARTLKKEKSAHLNNTTRSTKQPDQLNNMEYTTRSTKQHGID